MLFHLRIPAPLRGFLTLGEDDLSQDILAKPTNKQSNSDTSV